MNSALIQHVDQRDFIAKTTTQQRSDGHGARPGGQANQGLSALDDGGARSHRP